MLICKYAHAAEEVKDSPAYDLLTPSGITMLWNTEKGGGSASPPGYTDGVCSKLLTSLRLTLAFHTLLSPQNMADSTPRFVKGIVRLT